MYNVHIPSDIIILYIDAGKSLSRLAPLLIHCIYMLLLGNHAKSCYTNLARTLIYPQLYQEFKYLIYLFQAWNQSMCKWFCFTVRFDILIRQSYHSITPTAFRSF